nr:SDR family oxidoreductase [uncultured Cohaesibacter sp.]
MTSRIEELFSLAGKSAIVTGGAANIGFAAADILAAAGASLAITSRSMAKAQEACDRLANQHGSPCLALELDHTRQSSIDAALEAFLDWRPACDILINNAGGGSGASVAKLFEREPDDIRAMIESNLVGPLLCCRSFGKSMADQGHGKIINFGSIAAIVGRDRRIYEPAGMLGQPIDYAAAKGGIVAMTRDLAGYLGPMGINVNAISPGGIERNHHPAFVSGYSDLTPLGRMGHEPTDLEGAILFLASSASDYVHGHNLVVDGGFSVWK